MDSESVDLIATDPPFNKGVKAFEGITAAGTNVSYSDVWTWGDVQDNWTQSIRLDHPNLYAVIRSANAAAGEDMGAFLCWLGVRVLEMRRVLKPTGSLYLHCDHTASAYLKSMMDAVFGSQNIIDEVIWHYGTPSGGRSGGRKPVNVHDTIFVYAKEYGEHIYNRQFTRYSDKYVAERFVYADDDGRRYRTRKRAKGVVTRQYLDESPGVPLSTVWNDIKQLYAYHLVKRKKEETGYPTQKPLALYERIIKASSNPGDLVLDPFAGCATTCVGAERLGRRWIGMDINEEAGKVTLDRLQREMDAALNWDSEVSMLKSPPTRTDDGKAAAPELTLVSPRPAAPRLTARQLRDRLIKADGMICQGCGWPPRHEAYLEADHRIPKSRGGPDNLRNRVLLCSPCNSAKGNRLSLSELRERRLQQDRMVDKSWDMAWYERTGKFG